MHRKRVHAVARLVGVVVTLAGEASVMAQDDHASARSAVPSAADDARASARAVTHWLASGVDSWFGDRPFDEGGKVSDGRLSLGLLTRQQARSVVTFRFNARLRLPNLEERTYLFLGRDDPREVLTDQPGALSRQERLLRQVDDERRFFAGVGRSLTDRLDFRFGLRGGLKGHAQVRHRSQWLPHPRGLVEFRQTVFWSVPDRAGMTTAFSYEHLVHPVLATRWLGSATITQASRRWDWSSLLGIYRSFGGQRLLSAEARAQGQQGSGVPATDCGLQVRWEQPLHRDWLIGGVVVGRFWPRPDAQSERLGVWVLGASLHMRF